MNSLPLVSIIIPVFNCEKYVLHSILSILQQSYYNIELIICDDGSSDCSYEILKGIKDSRVILIRNEKNIGYLHTVNKLFSLIKGELIAFHDADDVSHVSRIMLQVEFLKSNPHVSLVGTNFDLIDRQGNQLKKNNIMQSDPNFIRENLINGNLFQKPSILFRREVYEKIGGFREGFVKLGNISEDYDWLLRASEHFLLSNINEEFPLYSYRSVPTAMSKNYLSVEQHIGHQIAQFLALERKKSNGVDSLMLGNFESLQAQIELLKLPYKKDESLFYFEKAESLMYSGLSYQALNIAFKGWVINPWSWRNLKCLLASIKRLQ